MRRRSSRESWSFGRLEGGKGASDFRFEGMVDLGGCENLEGGEDFEVLRPFSPFGGAAMGVSPSSEEEEEVVEDGWASACSLLCRSVAQERVPQRFMPSEYCSR